MTEAVRRDHTAQHLEGVVGRTMLLLDVHVPIPGTGEYVT